MPNALQGYSGAISGVEDMDQHLSKELNHFLRKGRRNMYTDQGSYSYANINFQKLILNFTSNISKIKG